ncbi:DMT family transporter [Desulfovibrio sp. SGI.169]|uniref:DMT family transporter n=1 Tax=Desulfovibrio sp. SGI.169 TaxID=3420561 RepID=UPI003CFE6EFC
MNPWLLLIAAGLCEIGWPLGFKLAQTAPAWRVTSIAFSVLSMAASGWLLFLAQKHIPIGTAYAVWTGIGAAGAFLIGVAVFGDALHWGRVLGALMIVGGVIVLKAVSP